MGARILQLAGDLHFQFESLLRQARKLAASDLYLKAGDPPMVRLCGRMVPLQPGLAALPEQLIIFVVDELLNPLLKKRLKSHSSLDISYDAIGVGRFRINISFNYGELVLSIRLINTAPRDFRTLGLPPVIEKIAGYERGLVLVTGKSGSGKSTTLAAMIDYIHKNFQKHIVSIEDPIEYRFTKGQGLVDQKEIGLDTPNFAYGLRTALRQNPDVILIGEIRDRETMDAALAAADTGHLVFSTLHTSDATGSINRVLAAYSSSHQKQVRNQLANNLKAVISQRLVETSNKVNLVPAVEVMMTTDRIQDLIRNSERTHEISSAIEEGYSTYGMQTFDQSLLDLMTRGIISYETAVRNSTRPADFEIKCSGVKSIDAERWQPFGIQDVELEARPQRLLRRNNN